MKNQRKETILNEILFWKENNLLPEHYCDFLSTLYAEGEELATTELEISSKNAILSKERSKKQWIMTLLGVSTISLLILLFLISVKFVVFPIIIVSITIVGLLFYVFKFATQKDILTTLAYTAAALLLLGISVRVMEIYLPDNPLAMHIAIIANCVLWLISGIWMKLIYFMISGAGGLLIIFTYILFF